jgi:hypothetical protein
MVSIAISVANIRGLQFMNLNGTLLDVTGNGKI